MPIETELKFRVESHMAVRSRLSTIGARYLQRVVETNWILDFADGSLQKQGCGLRVRLSIEHGTGNQETELTFKGPRAAGPFKTREELQTIVDDPEMVLKILAMLGLHPVLRYEKRRESWETGGCRIELDQPPEIGFFVEIEGPGGTEIREVQQQLGLEAGDVEPSSYVGLLLAHCKASGIRERTLELPPEG